MAHIALSAYELETGGISRVAVYLANGFAEAGHRVSLVLCTDKGVLHGLLAAQLDGRVDVVCLSEKPYKRRVMGQIATFAAFVRWLNQERPSHVMGTSNNISWFTGLSFKRAGAREWGARLYIKTTNPILRVGDGALLREIRRAGYRRLFANSDAVLTLSEVESRVLAGQFKGLSAKFSAVFNPYFTPEMQLASRGEQAGGPPIIAALGRLSPQKNFARAIRAFAKARALAAGAGDPRLTTAKLFIAGEGPLRAELEALIAELGLEGVVELPGFTNDAAGFLAGAHRYLLSSNYEGLPAVVIEALGSGLPVISTDCFPAARELLVCLPACEVTALDEDALAEAMLRSFAANVAPAALREKALDYGLESAANSHLRAMEL